MCRFPLEFISGKEVRVSLLYLVFCLVSFFLLLIKRISSEFFVFKDLYKQKNSENNKKKYFNFYNTLAAWRCYWYIMFGC